MQSSMKAAGLNSAPFSVTAARSSRGFTEGQKPGLGLGAKARVWERRSSVWLHQTQPPPRSSSQRKTPAESGSYFHSNFPVAADMPLLSKQTLSTSLLLFLWVPSGFFVDFLGTSRSCGDPHILSPLSVTLLCLWTDRNTACWPRGEAPAGPGPPAMGRLWSLQLSESRMLEFGQENRCALWANLTAEKHFPVPFKGAQLPG